MDCLIAIAGDHSTRREMNSNYYHKEWFRLSICAIRNALGLHWESE